MKYLKSTDYMSRIAVEKVPELQPYFDYVYDNEEDETMAYWFFNTDLAFIVMKLYVKAYDESSSKAENLLNRILDLIEEFATNKNEDVETVIHFGFLHGYSYLGAYYEPIKKLSRPKTLELLLIDEEFHGVPPLEGAFGRRSHRELDEIVEKALQIPSKQ